MANLVIPSVENYIECLFLPLLLVVPFAVDACAYANIRTHQSKHCSTTNEEVENRRKKEGTGSRSKTKQCTKIHRPPMRLSGKLLKAKRGDFFVENFPSNTICFQRFSQIVILPFFIVNLNKKIQFNDIKSSLRVTISKYKEYNEGTKNEKHLYTACNE